MLRVKRFFVNNSRDNFHFLKFSFTNFLGISQNFRAWWGLLGMAEISCWHQFFYLPFSNPWITLISKPPVQFGWKIPHKKAIIILFSNITNLNTFHVIFWLTSSVFNRFQEEYTMKNTTPFNFIWCHIVRFKKKKKIVHVQNMLEQILTHFCVDWIIFKKVMTIK